MYHRSDTVPRQLGVATCASTQPGSDSERCGLGLELRRVWAERDSEAVIRLLRDLAPKCRYNNRELARSLNITTRHLQRYFARSVGCSPQDWLNKQRLLAARDMLRTATSVKEVAYALGFSQAAQLSRDFRNLFGLPPSMLLPAAREGGEPEPDV